MRHRSEGQSGRLQLKMKISSQCCEANLCWNPLSPLYASLAPNLACTILHCRQEYWNKKLLNF